jgi:hypothetical protein
MSIHDEILAHLQQSLQETMIDDLPEDDQTRAGVVMQGPLQGEPEPDTARISVTIHENDPDGFYGKGGASTLSSGWEDEISEVECGGSVTWKRRFTIKARCLLVLTSEDLAAARRIASTVRSRLEQAVLQTSFEGVCTDDEFVSKGPVADGVQAEMVQAGGPPDSYDYHIKIRFEIETTTGVTP